MLIVHNCVGHQWRTRLCGIVTGYSSPRDSPESPTQRKSWFITYKKNKKREKHESLGRSKNIDNVQASIPSAKEYQAERTSRSLIPDPGKNGQC